MLAQELYRNAVYAGFTAGLPIEKPEDEQLDLVAINGRDFLNNITKDITGKPWHDDREQNYIIRCLRPAKCERIQTNTCFGGRIPYKFTSGQLSEEGNQEQNLKKLALLEALQNVPKCWEVIQVSFSFQSIFHLEWPTTLMRIYFIAVFVCCLLAQMHKDQG